MNSTSNESDLWQPCPPGELGRLTGRLRRRRYGWIAARATAVVAVLLVAVGGLTWQFGEKPQPAVVSRPGEGFDYGGITCTGVHRVLPQLKAGTIDAATLSRVREHLEKCDHCRGLSRYLPDAASQAVEWPFKLARRPGDPSNHLRPGT